MKFISDEHVNEFIKTRIPCPYEMPIFTYKDSKIKKTITYFECNWGMRFTIYINGELSKFYHTLREAVEEYNKL